MRKTFATLGIFGFVATTAPAGLVAQTELSETQEIALAVSAAPSNLSDDATVLVLDGNRYRVAREGSNGVTCMVSRSRPLSMEPICYDPEASRTILEIEKRRVELRLDGLSPEEIESRERAAIDSGEITLPEGPAMAYMMSANQVLYADDTTLVGSWNPHMHVYSPYATPIKHGISGSPSLEATMVADEGEPNASLIIILREFTSREE